MGILNEAPSLQTLLTLLKHARRVHFEGVIPYGSFCHSLSSHQLVSQERSRGQVLLFPFTPSLNDATCSQIDAIPTVGFSDPILSYFSALQFNFDGVRMLREGYEKVNCFFLHTSFLVRI
jgi:hypothetical protein